MGSYVRMPILGLTMTSGLITRWLKKEGDPVTRGEKLLEIESDKSSFEYESESSGLLLKCYYAEGMEIACQTVIAFIGTEDEEAPLKPPDEKIGNTPSGKEGGAAAVADPPAQLPASDHETARRIASPRARRYAREHSIDLFKLPRGSGAGGRIEEKDVAAYRLEMSHPADLAGGLDSSLETEILPVSRMRAAIARRLTESNATPHFYLSLSINMEYVHQKRSLNHEQASRRKISLNAILIKAASTALERHPTVNSSWAQENILRHYRTDIAIAVATQSGLLTPVVRGCNGKSIAQIDTELQALIDAARQGNLKPQDYEGATFTISNLGSYDIENFMAIINPPASAILAVGRIMERPVVIDHVIVAKPMMYVTMSCDHRVIDGTAAAAFLKELKEILETSPLTEP